MSRKSRKSGKKYNIDPDKDSLRDDMKKWRQIGSIPVTAFAEAAFGLDGDNTYDPFIYRNMGIRVKSNYMPRMQQVPRHVEFANGMIQKVRAFSASEKKKFGAAVRVKGSKKLSMIWPRYWLNPYQYQDYVILQDNYANTIAGRIIDTLVFFILANGIKPKLEPKNRDNFESEEALQNAMEEGQFLIDILEEIDRNVSTIGEPQPFKTMDDTQQYVPYYSEQAEDVKNSYDTPLQQKWAAVCTLALNFGRAVLIPQIDEQDDTVIIDDVTYRNIPKVIKVIHPRDLGFNHISPETWKLLGIQLYNSNWILRPNHMMFFEWNPHNPVYGGMYYGYSLAQSMIGSARALRRIIEVDFPLIAKTRWSSMYWVFFKRKGEGLTTAEAEHQAILNSIRLDGINISLEDEPTEDVRVERVDLDPKIQELIEMARFLIQYMMAQVGMPQGMMFDEQALNRATLIGKIRSFIQGPIRKYRKWFLGVVTEQWYNRMVVTISADNEKIKNVLKDFNVIAEVDEFKLENWNELIQAFLMLQQLNPFKDEAIGDFLNIEGYESFIDKDKELPPLPGKMSMKVTDSAGKSFGVEG